VAFSIFDTGASAITFAASDQANYVDPIPVKVAGGAMADGIGGGITGDVSEPGTILADGLHAAQLTFDSLGFPVFNLSFGADTAAAPGVQAFVGTDAGSPDMPTITGTPILNPSPDHPNGLAARVDLQGAQLDFSDVIPGLILPMPDLHFVAPGTLLTADTGTTAPVRVPLGLYGSDNHLNPGDVITESPSPIQPDVQVVNAGVAIPHQHFLLDTGAQLSVISTAEAQTLGLDLAHPTTSITVQGVAGTEDVPGYTIDEIDVPLSDGGTLAFTHVPVYVLDIADGIDGLLGMNLFNTASSMLYDPFDSSGPSLQLTFFTDRPTGGDLGTGDVGMLQQLGVPFTGALDGHNLPGYSTPATDPPLTTSASGVSALEGTGFSGVVTTFTDKDPAGVVTDYTATIAWGDGTSSAGTIAANGHGGFDVSGTHTYLKDGSFPVTVVVHDKAGSVASAGTNAVVADASLSATGTTISAAEGASTGPVVLATFTDSGSPEAAGSYTTTIDWGDGSPVEAGTVSLSGNTFSVSGSHTYSREGSFTIAVTIKDSGGSQKSASGNANVSDASLLATGTTIRALEGASTGSLVLATFTDAGGPEAAGSYMTTIDWGDGSPVEAGVVSLSGSTLNVSGSHTYARQGSFTVGITIADSGGSQIAVNGSAVVSTANSRFVARAFQDLFARSVDASGLAFWTDQLGRNVPRSVIAAALTHSAEYYQTNVIKPAYRQFLQREADPAGLAFWTQQLQGGLTDEQMQAGFIASAEFYEIANHASQPVPVTATNDRAWVDALYEALLGRGPDQAGEDFWTSQLQGRETRLQVANGFTGSSEGISVRIQQTYERYLGRGADPAGLAFWLSQYQVGAVNEDIVIGFIGSDEYFKQATM
jgi:hypothetical protein